MSTYPTSMAKPLAIRKALTIYRVLAIIAGLALFVLLAAIFVHYGPPRNARFSELWSPIHGVIYMAYAVSIFNLGSKSGWSLTRIVLNMLTGFVPVLPFIAERRVTADTEALLSRAYVATPDGATRTRAAGGSAAEASGSDTSDTSGTVREP